MSVEYQLDEVEREIATLEAALQENANVRRPETVAKLNKLRSVDVTKMSVDEIIDHNGTVAAVETLLSTLVQQSKSIDSKLRQMRQQRMRLQEARTHHQMVEQFRDDVIQGLQSRRSELLAQLAKVDAELAKHRVVVS